MNSDSQPDQSMDNGHPDQRVRARRARIKQARVGDDLEKAGIDSSEMVVASDPTGTTVTIPISTWQEVLRLARVGEEAMKSAQGDELVQEAQQQLEGLVNRAPQDLEATRAAAMVAALRHRRSAAIGG